MEEKGITTKFNVMELTEDILRSAYENMLDDISSFYCELCKAFTDNTDLTECNPEYLL
jgi:hypothetical protein